MQHVWVLIVVFGAGMLVTALATQSVALGIGRRRHHAPCAWGAAQLAVRAHVEVGFWPTPRYYWRPSVAGTSLYLVGLLLIAASVWRLYLA
jgi:hypothetical protein